VSCVSFYVNNKVESILQITTWCYFFASLRGTYQTTRSWRGVLDTKVGDKVCQLLVAGLWVFPVSSTNKTDLHDLTTSQFCQKIFVCSFAA
jgi:hypothetical protein